MTPASKALACADAGASLRMTNNNKFVDSCRLLGNYNGENIYLYSSAKYDRPRLFYTPNYYYLPKWVEDHEKLTLLQAIKIINYRMKNKNNDSDNLKPEEINIDATIDSVKNEK
jgi:hypothetical protein